MSLLQQDVRRYRRRTKKGTPVSRGPESRYNMVVRHLDFVEPPPEQVLAERDAAMGAPQSLTAILFGDPPPGRSALDRRMGRTP